jgi:3-deoxy-7-phosphoheptulonate synthase
MRGGAFKPRSSPYSFRGMGIDGLKMFYDIVKPLGIKIISEVLEISQIQEMYSYVDIFQVGARNSQNFNLLFELGKVDKPVLIKRGLSGTLEELLQSAEYVFSNGNEKIIICERGIRTYEKAYRNTLDLNAVPVLKDKTHLPVVVDPSHGIGIRRYIEPMTLAALAAGADGILMEVHEKPENAFSDGDQTVNYEEASEIIRKAKNLL